MNREPWRKKYPNIQNYTRHTYIYIYIYIIYINPDELVSLPFEKKEISPPNEYRKSSEEFTLERMSQWKKKLIIYVVLLQIQTMKDFYYNSSKYQYFPVLCFKLQIVFKTTFYLEWRDVSNTS